MALIRVLHFSSKSRQNDVCVRLHPYWLFVKPLSAFSCCPGCDSPLDRLFILLQERDQAKRAEEQGQRRYGVFAYNMYSNIHPYRRPSFAPLFNPIISGIDLFNFRRRAEREDERNRIRAKYGLATTSTGAAVTTSSHYQADKKADGGGCVLS